MIHLARDLCCRSGRDSWVGVVGVNYCAVNSIQLVFRDYCCTHRRRGHHRDA